MNPAFYILMGEIIIVGDERAKYTEVIVSTTVSFLLVIVIVTLVLVLITYYWRRKIQNSEIVINQDPIYDDPDTHYISQDQKKLNSTADKMMLSHREVPQEMKENIAYFTHPHQEQQQELSAVQDEYEL